MIYHNNLSLLITSKEVLLDDPDKPLRFTTSYTRYHEGTHMICKYTDIDGVDHEIDSVYKTSNDISDDYYQNCVLILEKCEIDETI